MTTQLIKNGEGVGVAFVEFEQCQIDARYGCQLAPALQRATAAGQWQLIEAAGEAALHGVTQGRIRHLRIVTVSEIRQQ